MPWLLSLAVDGASTALIARGGAAAAAAAAARSPALAHTPTAAAYAAAEAGWTADEAAELSRRRALLFLYAARPPAYSSVVAPSLARTARALGRVPLIGGLAGKLVELADGFTSYYTYTAGS